MTAKVYRHAQPEYLTVQAFAEHFGVSKMTIYRLVSQGQVAAIQIGRSVRIPVAELKRYVKDANVRAGGAA